MNLRQFTLMDPQDEIAWLQFLGANEQSHQTIAARVETKNKVIPRVPLSGDPRKDPNWMSDHNRMHQAEGLAIGLSIPPLNDYDLNDPAQFAEWMYLHGAVHAAENDVLGIY